MTISSTTMIDRVLLIISGAGSEFDTVLVYNGTESTGNIDADEWASREAEIAEVNDRIQAGTATLRYSVGDSLYDASALPAYLEGLVFPRDPFMPLNYTAPQVDHADGPYQEVWYKRAALAPGLPSFADFTAGNLAVANIMEGAGWSRLYSAGTDTLWVTDLTWSISAAEVRTISALPPRSDDWQFSTDGGQTWSAEAPADADEIDAVRHYNPGRGAWVIIPIAPGDERENPHVRWPGDYWQNPSSWTVDQDISPPSGVAVTREGYAITIDIWEQISWSDSRPRLRGYVEWPVDRINLITPAEYAADADQYVSGKGHILLQDTDIGSLRMGVAHPDRRLSDFSASDYNGYLIYFVDYPTTTLYSGVDVGTATMRIVSNAEIEIGDTLFVDDEQVIVTHIGSQGGGFSQLTVTRGANGTTAAQHAAGAAVRAVHADSELRFVRIAERRNVSGQTRFHVGHKKIRGL